MKKLTFIAILAFTLLSCGEKKVSKDLEPKPGTDYTHTFGAIMNGDWYQASYIDSLQKTKSPFRSQNALSEFVELSIHIEGKEGDSIKLGAIGIHEGADLMVYLRPGLTSTSLPTDAVDYPEKGKFLEIGYRISKRDTSVFIYGYNSKKQLVYQHEYRRGMHQRDGLLQYMVNKTLFAGSYKSVDSSGQVSILKFSNDGLLYGFPNHTKYYVITNFEAETENNVDQVCFDMQTKNQKCYGFSIQEDTIKLYELLEIPDTVGLGQLKYTLIKQ